MNQTEKDNFIEQNFDIITVPYRDVSISILVEKKGWYQFQELLNENMRLRDKYEFYEKWDYMLDLLTQFDNDMRKLHGVREKKKRIKELLENIKTYANGDLMGRYITWLT
jgi:hypothetical protein